MTSSESNRLSQAPRRGGVQNSVIMCHPLNLLVILTTIATLNPYLNTLMTLDLSRKTTTFAECRGKCLMPANTLAKDMGSVKVQLHPNRQSDMTGNTPDWAKRLHVDIKSDIEKSNQDITGKVKEVAKDLNDFKEESSKEVKEIRDQLKDLNLEQQTLKGKFADMEKEKTSWEKGLIEDNRRLQQGRSVVHVAAPSQEDIDEYNKQFDRMTRTVGLSPFSEEDFDKQKDLLLANNLATTDDNILSLALMEFWEKDLGIDKIGVEQLSNDMEKIWWQISPKRYGDKEETKAIFARFKTESGRITMYKRARNMNGMCKKFGIEPRRILIDVIPQQERRFGVMKRLEREFRDKEKEEYGEKPQTKIEFEDGTMVVQYRFDYKENWRTLDLDKYFPKVKIPGIRYSDKVPFAVRPKAYQFKGINSPPGRIRHNKPRPSHEPNPTREERQALIDLTSNNNPEAANNNDDDDVEVMEDEEPEEEDTVKTLTSNLALLAKKGMVNLDGIPPMPTLTSSNSGSGAGGSGRTPHPVAKKLFVTKEDGWTSASQGIKRIREKTSPVVEAKKKKAVGRPPKVVTKDKAQPSVQDVFKAVHGSKPSEELLRAMASAEQAEVDEAENDDDGDLNDEGDDKPTSALSGPPGKKD